jgi:hypothetical protein
MMVYGGEVVYERSGNPRVSKVRNYDIAPSWSPKNLFCAVRWCVAGGMMVYGGEVVYERSGNPRVSKIACHLYCRIASQLCVRLRHQTKQQISASAMQTALAASG